MSFVYAPALFLLVLLIPVTAFLVWRNRVRLLALRRLGDPALIRALAPSISVERRWWKIGLWLAAVAALIVALARPVWGVDLDVIETQGISVMVVLDVSTSMNAQDVAPSRLERARLAIRELFDRLAGNEIGLILFAGTAFVQFPLTTDSISAQSFLNAVSTDAITLQGTAIEDALRLAMNTFSPQSPAAKVIVLMTDGESHEGNALAAAGDAAEQGITIHTVGFGDPQGSAIPLLDERGLPAGYKTDAAGNVVLSRLDEETLQAIAERAGGVYQLADVDAVVKAINSTQAGVLETRTEQRGVERFGIFVALALLALSLEMLLPETRLVTGERP